MEWWILYIILAVVIAAAVAAFFLIRKKMRQKMEVQKELVNRDISASLIKIVPPLSENLDTAYGEGSQMNVDIRVLSNC